MRFASKLSILLCLAAPAALAATDAQAREGGRGHWMHKELNLTDEQKAKVKEIRKKHRDAVKAQKKSLREAKEDLVSSLQAPRKGPEYKAELLKKFDQLEAQRAAFHRKRFEMALEIREILTDEQIAKFKAHHEGKGRGRGRHADHEDDGL